MFFHRHITPGLAIHSFLVGDESTKQCAVIDPARDVDVYIAIAQKEGLTITDILETHVHADFVSGSVELKARLSGAPKIHCSAMGGDKWIPKYCDDPVKEGSEVVLGAIRLRALHTPGHTPEHIMWILYDDAVSREIPQHLFTGDCLFVNAVGRPDLLGLNELDELSGDLYRTLFEKVLQLPDSIEIHPSHGEGSLCGKKIGARSSSTLGNEKLYNPYLKKLEKKEWIDHLMHEMPKSPTYFPRMKRINVEGPPLIKKGFDRLTAISAAEAKRLAEEEGAVIVDARDQHAFAVEHIKDSMNIPYGKNMSLWAGWFLQNNQPIILTSETEELYHDICLQLLLVGIDQVIGCLEGGVSAWKESNYPTASFGPWSTEKLYASLLRGDLVQIVDVRTQEEWRGGHIHGALHLPIDQLKENISLLCHDQPVALVCRTGYRASLAGSIAERAGLKHLINIDGGMTSWIDKHFPLVKPQGDQ